MVSRFLQIAIGAIVLGTTVPAVAQQSSTNQVATKTAWSVFEDGNPKECWAVAAPSETVNTKDGRVVSVTRSDILLMAFYRPGAGASGQVAFTGGYPFAEGSSVSVEVDGNRFELFTQGEWAWPENPAADAKIITALKRGKNAILSARSSRGTKTKDTFSLLGFTAAVEDAAARCK